MRLNIKNNILLQHEATHNVGHSVENHKVTFSVTETVDFSFVTKFLQHRGLYVLNFIKFVRVRLSGQSNS